MGERLNEFGKDALKTTARVVGEAALVGTATYGIARVVGVPPAEALSAAELLGVVGGAHATSTKVAEAVQAVQSVFKR